MRIPRVVIAGTNSGCGKTTITAGLMAAMVNRGLRVQPFKAGPDYIDPMFHTFITGRYSRNLDSWILKEEVLSWLFQKNVLDADIALIEGVMGLYDGYGTDSKEGSTAHTAGIIKAPVILVINGEGLSLSAAALVQGFAGFDREIDIKGVIINNIKSEQHFKLLKEAIEENTGIAAVGYLCSSEEYAFESRHLGLVPSGEIEGLKEKIEYLASQIAQTVDLELIWKIACSAPELPDMQCPLNLGDCGSNQVKANKHKSLARIGVAMDKAFNFYYRDNLDLMELLGAELVHFSPLKDGRLPEDIHGLYIGGGYPEVYAACLEANESMKQNIKQRISEGLPAYAECGGFMYLTESIADKNGSSFKMVGAIPGCSSMTNSLKRFGYVDVEVSVDCILAKKGYKIRAHEFHYSVAQIGQGTEACYNVSKSRRGKEVSRWQCGYKVQNLLAGYPHLHFWANPDFARELINNCKRYKDGKVL